MKKNLAKLVKKVVTDKNGKKMTVWVKQGEAPKTAKHKEGMSNSEAVKTAIKLGGKVKMVDGEIKVQLKDGTFLGEKKETVKKEGEKKEPSKIKAKAIELARKSIVDYNKKWKMSEIENDLKKMKGISNVSRVEMGYDGSYSPVLTVDGKFENFLGKELDFDRIKGIANALQAKDYDSDELDEVAFGTIEFEIDGDKGCQIYHTNDSYYLDFDDGSDTFDFDNRVDLMKKVKELSGRSSMNVLQGKFEKMKLKQLSIKTLQSDNSGPYATTGTTVRRYEYSIDGMKKEEIERLVRADKPEFLKQLAEKTGNTDSPYVSAKIGNLNVEKDKLSIDVSTTVYHN